MRDRGGGNREQVVAARDDRRRYGKRGGLQRISVIETRKKERKAGKVATDQQYGEKGKKVVAARERERERERERNERTKVVVWLRHVRQSVKGKAGGRGSVNMQPSKRRRQTDRQLACTQGERERERKASSPACRLTDRHPHRLTTGR